MAIFYRQLDQLIVVSGKTYPYREMIKGLGGRFESNLKVWHVPHSEQGLKQVDELCRSVGGGPLRSGSPKNVKANKIAVAHTQTEAATPSPATDAGVGMTVSELMQKTQLSIQAAFPRAIWVLGEVQSLSHRKSGSFFQLADFKEGASRSATMTVNVTLWGQQARSLSQKLGRDQLAGILQDGMKLRVLAQVSLYQDRGQLSLNILDIDPRYTKGNLALAREELLRELRQKGLDRLNASRPLSPFPLLIGLVSAAGSRAQSDFLHQLEAYGFPGTVRFCPAQMQGEKTLDEVSQAIHALAAENCDLIVVTRGGGSLADLRWFDSKEIALAIANCPVPVIAAIGHHEDVCVAEELAHRREKTPTAAADFIISIFAQTRERMNHLSQYLLKRLQDTWLSCSRELQQNTERLRHLSHQRLGLYNERLGQQSYQLRQAMDQRLYHFERRVRDQQQAIKIGFDRQLINLMNQLSSFRQSLCDSALDNLAQHQMPLLLKLTVLQKNYQSYLTEWERNLLMLDKSLAQADPRPWLQRGWTRLETTDGLRITTAAEVQQQQLLQARLIDGLLHLRIEKIGPVQKIIRSLPSIEKEDQ